MMSFLDYADHDGLGLAELVRRGEVSPAELLETALAAIERLNPEINAVIAVLADEARKSLADRATTGPFAGVPFLLKDLVVSYAGVPTNSGSRFLAGWTRDHDSEILIRWKSAGLSVVGKTNTPEMGSSGSTEPVAYGSTRNPWRTDSTPGGSSGGAAAAVAAGMVPVAHASDGGGSIRGPASCCGVVGLKPTRGRNPLGPDAGEMWDGLVVEHVVTRTVRDSAALLDATAGPDVGAPYYAAPPERPFLQEVGRNPGRLRIGFSDGTPPGQQAHSDCREAVRRAAATLEELGHIVEPAEPEHDCKRTLDIFMTLFAAHTAAFVDYMAKALGRIPSAENMEANNLYLLEQGRRLSAKDLLSAQMGINDVTRRFAQFFTKHDVWLTPTMATPPPKLGHLHADKVAPETFFDRLWHFNTANMIYNISGLPAISLPLHQSDDGLPIGVMLGARFGEEALLFRLAGQLEEARPWRDRHPPVGLWGHGAEAGA